MPLDAEHPARLPATRALRAAYAARLLGGANRAERRRNARAARISPTHNRKRKRR